MYRLQASKNGIRYFFCCCLPILLTISGDVGGKNGADGRRLASSANNVKREVALLNIFYTMFHHNRNKMWKFIALFVR